MEAEYVAWRATCKPHDPDRPRQRMDGDVGGCLASTRVAANFVVAMTGHSPPCAAGVVFETKDGWTRPVKPQPVPPFCMTHNSQECFK